MTRRSHALCDKKSQAAVRQILRFQQLMTLLGAKVRNIHPRRRIVRQYGKARSGRQCAQALAYLQHWQRAEKARRIELGHVGSVIHAGEVAHPRRALKAPLVLAAVFASPTLAEPRPDGAVAFVVTDASRIEASLTGEAGDPDAGRALFLDPEATGCAACHGDPESQSVPASGPPLDTVGARLAPGELRLWIVAPEVRVPATRMPAYFAPNQRRAADDDRFGGPRLRARDIEDLVAYLATLGGNGRRTD